jgi:two-component sensor histidine kinase
MDAHGRLQEANHRIANNLLLVGAMVRTQARALKRRDRPLTPSEAHAMLHEVAARIEMVGRLHRVLSDAATPASLNLGQYLSDVCDVAAATMSVGDGADVSLEFEEPCIVGAEQILPLGLIVNEAVTNALKYAHPTGVRGRILVSCETIEGALHVTVEDDGVGLPEGFDANDGGGLGLQIIRALAEQLGATLMFEGPGIGLRVAIRLPASPKPKLALRA